MKKAFVISWYFPPINSSEGLVTFKLLKNSKYKYDVFTQKGDLSWTYGDREERLVSKNINTIFSNSSALNDWVNEGVEYFKKHHSEYEYIMSRAMAPESHVMALKIKELFPDVKWIASFGDPICNNPFVKFYRQESPYRLQGFERGIVGFRYMLSPKRIIKNAIWKYRYNHYLKHYDTEPKYQIIERDTLKNADKIILNNPYELDHMLKSNNGFEDKVIILPHSYDKEFYSNKKYDFGDNKIHISFLGHLDKARSPKQLFVAVKRLLEKNPDLGDKLSIDFYGDMDDQDKLYVINNYLLDVVHFKKSVDYFKSLEIMKSSDWVLNVDTNFSYLLRDNIFFPAKLADYLGSGTNIMSISMDSGPTADIMRENRHLLLSFSADEIYMNLKMILNGEIKLENKNKNIEKYNAVNVAKDYDKFVENFIKRG